MGTSDQRYPRQRRKPDTSVSININRWDDVSALVAKLKAAAKKARHMGGQHLVAVHDCNDDGVVAFIYIDLTWEALRL